MITTECNAEPYIKWFDGYLTWHWQEQNMVPAFPAVYGGALQMFGRAYRGGPSQDLAHRMKAGQQLVFGEQIGWFGPEVIDRPDSGKFLRDCIQLRWRLKEYFYKGRMARPPKLTGPGPHGHRRLAVAQRVAHHDRGGPDRGMATAEREQDCPVICQCLRQSLDVPLRIRSRAIRPVRQVVDGRLDQTRWKRGSAHDSDGDHSRGSECPRLGNHGHRSRAGPRQLAQAVRTGVGGGRQDLERGTLGRCAQGI